MSKRILVKADGAASPITYVRGIGDKGGGFLQDAAAMFGRAYTPSQQNKFQKVPVSGGERFRAAANLLGRGAAAGLTGLQTAYGLQGGNVGALGQIGDVYGQNVQGLTPFGSSQAQQAADMTEDIQARADQKAREEYVQNQIAQNMQQSQQRQDPSLPRTDSMYGQTMPNGQMTFNVQGQQSAAQQPAAQQPAAPTTGVNTDVAQATAAMNVPSAQQPIQISNPFAGATPEVSSAVNNLVTGGMTGQGPVNPNNRQAMVNAGRNIGYEMASNISAQPTQTNDGYIQPAAHTSYTQVSGISGGPSQRPQPASYQPSQKEQELIQRTAAQGGFLQQGELNALNQHRQSQGLPPLSLQEALALAKSFVNYAYELHGDILRKATPHEAGLLVMNMYLEMLR